MRCVSGRRMIRNRRRARREWCTCWPCWVSDELRGVTLDDDPGARRPGRARAPRQPDRPDRLMARLVRLSWHGSARSDTLAPA